jgi:hypothetical protein
MLSLAASDVHCAPGKEVLPSQSPWHKTSFYNMLETAGQTIAAAVE